jgi:hypothetical protein
MVAFKKGAITVQAMITKEHFDLKTIPAPHCGNSIPLQIIVTESYANSE